MLCDDEYIRHLMVVTITILAIFLQFLSAHNRVVYNMWHF